MNLIMTKNRSSLSFAVLLAALIVLFSGLGFAQSDSNALAPLVVNAGSSEDEVKSEEDASGDGSPESSTDEKTVSADKEEDPVEKARTAELKRLKDEREMIQARLALRSEQFKEELIGLKEEKERLSTENSLVRERLSDELTELKLANERLNAQIDTLNKELSFESLKAKKLLNEELSEMRIEEERLKLQNSIALKKMETEVAELRLADTRLKLKRATLDIDVAELTAKLMLKEKGDLVQDQVYADRDLMYLKEPFVDGVLHVSDRRVALNGPIWSGLADYVSERINFYNNESSDYPIFLVIDSSPGGSVMSGYKIMKAMHGSKAPVYVVVKSYAASMAASIATLAERSFCYPNAVILHHQISWGVSGNLTQQREFLEEAEEWWRRVARPVAKKMGLSLDEFISLMYEKNSDGDWREFGDMAFELKWIDRVVDRIWEMSVDKNPDRFGRSMIFATSILEESIDQQGKPFVGLPRLEPFDFYYLYNPDNYYRLR
jgi:ATP-dependent Clp protease protease subunit